MRTLLWLGDAKKRMKAFPKEVRRAMGGALMAAQCGEAAAHVKPFKGVGSGVFEIVEPYRKNAYRTVYAVRIGEAVYVLHAFQKKSKTGVATPKPDVALIKQRYKEALEHAKHSP